MDQLTAHLDRGWELVSRGDFHGARLSAQKGLEMEAQSPEAFHLLAYVHASEGNVHEALENYVNAIACDETFIEAMLNAAELFIHPVGNLEAATRLIEEAFEYCETPDELADAILLRVDVLLAQGKTNEAKAYLDKLPSGPFESDSVGFRMGRARLHLGEVSKARVLLRKAVELFPHDPEVQFCWAICLDRSGDPRSGTVAFLRTRELEAAAPPFAWSIPGDRFELLVQESTAKLSEASSKLIHNALIIVCELPGAEVVADGIDPRAPVWLDAPPGQTRIERVFVYQRNVERNVTSASDIPEQILASIEHEIQIFQDAIRLSKHGRAKEIASSE